MNDYVLRLKRTEIVLPHQKKAESKCFPRAKVRTFTPKNVSFYKEIFGKIRPQTPKPSLSLTEGKMKRTSKINDQRVRNNSIYRKDFDGAEEGVLWMRKGSHELKRVRVKIRSPTRLLVIPKSSIKAKFEDKELSKLIVTSF